MMQSRHTFTAGGVALVLAASFGIVGSQGTFGAPTSAASAESVAQTKRYAYTLKASVTW